MEKTWIFLLQFFNHGMEGNKNGHYNKIWRMDQERLMDSEFEYFFNQHDYLEW